MKLLSATYNGLLNLYRAAPGRSALVMRALTEVLIGIATGAGDPGVTTSIRGVSLEMPISHRLPLYIIADPHYDELPRRVARFLRQRQGHLNMIDVGANIGDTVTACAEAPDDRFLAVEPDPHFVRFLKRNSAGIANCQIVEALCGPADGEIEALVEEQRGTAVISAKKGAPRMSVRSVDSIVEEKELADVNFLKIDTDGHDFSVLEGSRHTLMTMRPAILFETEPAGNPAYVDELVAAVRLLADAGYADAIAYDNLGYLFSVFDVRDVAQFKYALLYQLTSKFRYFDILAMPAEYSDDFVHSEVEYYTGLATSDGSRQAAAAAAALESPLTRRATDAKRP